eukprot:COSAG06_NODE_24890_length_650_cov_0.589837_1_plen_100_part_10
MPTQTGARADAAPTFNVLDRAQQEQVNRLSDEAATNRGGWGAAACAAATGPAWGFMTAEEKKRRSRGADAGRTTFENPLDEEELNDDEGTAEGTALDHVN